MGLVGAGLRRGSTCQRDVATHTLHGAAVRCTQSTGSLLGRLGVGVVGDEQVKLRLSERLSDPAADAARAASHDSSATQSIALRYQEEQRHTHHAHALVTEEVSINKPTTTPPAMRSKRVEGTKDHCAAGAGSTGQSKQFAGSCGGEDRQRAGPRTCKRHGTWQRKLPSRCQGESRSFAGFMNGKSSLEKASPGNPVRCEA